MARRKKDDSTKQLTIFDALGESDHSAPEPTAAPAAAAEPEAPRKQTEAERLAWEDSVICACDEGISRADMKSKYEKIGKAGRDNTARVTVAKSKYHPGTWEVLVDGSTQEQFFKTKKEAEAAISDHVDCLNDEDEWQAQQAKKQKQPKPAMPCTMCGITAVNKLSPKINGARCCKRCEIEYKSAKKSPKKAPPKPSTADDIIRLLKRPLRPDELTEYNWKACPKCGCQGDIAEKFGYRNCAGITRAQSQCKKCRGKKL